MRCASSLRAIVMAQPPEGREEYLLGLVLELAGRPVEGRIAAMRIAFDLTPSEARVLCALLARPGLLHSRERLFAALYGLEEGPAAKTLEVMLSRIRAKLAARAGLSGVVRNAWGQGWLVTIEAAERVEALLGEHAEVRS